MSNIRSGEAMHPKGSESAAGVDFRSAMVFTILFGLFWLSRSQNVLWGEPFSLSSDEYFSYFRTQHFDVGAFLQMVSPVYYAVTAALVEWFGYADFWLRAFPYAASLAAACVFFWLVRRQHSLVVAAVFLILMIASPVHMYFSTMARFYGPTFFFVGTFLLVFGGVFARDRIGIRAGLMLALLALLAIATHTASVIPIGSAIACYYLNRLIKGRLDRRQIATGLALAAGFLGLCFWYFFIAGEIDKLSIEPSRSLQALRGAVFDVTLPLFVFSLSYGAYMWIRDRSDSITFLLGTICISYASYLGISLVYDQAVRGQYVFNVLSLFFLLGAIGVTDLASQLRDQLGRLVAGSGIVALLIVSNLPDMLDFFKDGERYNYKAATRYVERKAGGSDVLFIKGIKGTPLTYASVYTKSLHSEALRLHQKQIDENVYRDFGDYIDFDAGCLRSGQVWVVFQDELIDEQQADWFFDSMVRVHAIGSEKRFNHHNRKLNIYRSRFAACEPPSA